MRSWSLIAVHLWQLAFLFAAAWMSSACGGGGGSGIPPTNSRTPLPQVVQDTNPSGQRTDVTADEFFVFVAGDKAQYNATTPFGIQISVAREVIAGPDAQGRTTIRESAPANPSFDLIIERWQRHSDGLRIFNRMPFKVAVKEWQIRTAKTRHFRLKDNLARRRRRSGQLWLFDVHEFDLTTTDKMSGKHKCSSQSSITEDLPQMTRMARINPGK